MGADNESKTPDARTLSGALQILGDDTKVGFETGGKIGHYAAVTIDAAVRDTPTPSDKPTFGEALILSTGVTFGLIVGAAVGIVDVAKQAAFPPKDPAPPEEKKR